GDLEGLVPTHFQEGQTALVEDRRRRVLAAAAGHEDELGHRAVAVHGGPEEAAAVVFGRLEEDGPGAVAEEDAGRAVGPVADLREDLAADDKDVLRHAALNELLGDGERVDEAGAAGREVEGAGAGGADPVLDQVRGR